MTRKHFEALANILKETEATNDTVIQMALYFEEVNSRFDPWKFYQACGKVGMIQKPSVRF